MQVFCGGVGPDFPDITGASRAMNESEYETCQANGVDSITEVLLGYDGLSIAHSVDGAGHRPEQGADLPGARLRGRGRRRRSCRTPTRAGTRSTPRCPTSRSRSSARRRPPAPATPSSSWCMHEGCEAFAGDRRARGRPQGRGLRADAPGRPVHRGRRERQPDRAAPRGRPARARHLRLLVPLREHRQAEGRWPSTASSPNADTIASGEYAVSRPLFIYVKNAHRGVIPGLDEFLDRVRLRGELRPGRLPAGARPDPARGRGARRGARRGRRRRARWTASTEPRSADPGRARASARAPSDPRGPPVFGYLFLIILAARRSPPTSSATISARRFVGAGGRAGCTRCRATTAPSSRSGSGCRRWSSCCSGCCSRAASSTACWCAACPTASPPDAGRAAVDLMLSEIHNVAAGRAFAEPTPGVAAAADAAEPLDSRSRGSRCSRSRSPRCSSASSSPAPASRRSFRARNGGRARAVGLHGRLLAGRDPDHRRHHRLAPLRGLGLLRAGAAGRLLLRPAAGSRRSPSAPTRSPAPAPSARCRSSSARW